MDAVLEATKEARHKFNVAVTQWLHGPADNRTLTTRVAHGGQWMKASMHVPVAKSDAQGVKSAYTLLERAAFTAAVGISPDEDDDGNASVAKDVKRPLQNFAPKPTSPIKDSRL